MDEGGFLKAERERMMELYALAERDAESAHKYADELLLGVIEQLAVRCQRQLLVPEEADRLSLIMKLFDDMRKWYS